MKKFSGEAQTDAYILPAQYINIGDPFKWGEHYACTPMAPTPVGAEYKGEGYKAQAGGSGGDPFAGKGSM